MGPRTAFSPHQRDEEQLHHARGRGSDNEEVHGRRSASYHADPRTPTACLPSAATGASNKTKTARTLFCASRGVGGSSIASACASVIGVSRTGMVHLPTEVLQYRLDQDSLWLRHETTDQTWKCDLTRLVGAAPSGIVLPMYILRSYLEECLSSSTRQRDCEARMVFLQDIKLLLLNVILKGPVSDWKVVYRIKMTLVEEKPRAAIAPDVETPVSMDQSPSERHQASNDDQASEWEEETPSESAPMEEPETEATADANDHDGEEAEQSEFEQVVVHQPKRQRVNRWRALGAADVQCGIVVVNNKDDCENRAILKSPSAGCAPKRKHQIPITPKTPATMKENAAMQTPKHPDRKKTRAASATQRARRGSSKPRDKVQVSISSPTRPSCTSSSTKQQQQQQLVFLRVSSVKTTWKVDQTSTNSAQYFDLNRTNLNISILQSGYYQLSLKIPDGLTKVSLMQKPVLFRNGKYVACFQNHPKATTLSEMVQLTVNDVVSVGVLTDSNPKVGPPCQLSLLYIQE